MQAVLRGAGIRVALIAAAMLFASAVVASTAQAEFVDSPAGDDLTLNDNTVAAPYPADTTLETADGEITDIDVLVELSHGSPDDVDIALVSPRGDSEMLLSDGCGNTDLTNVDLTFDADAPNGVPDLGPCSSGSFKPANHNGGDFEQFPAPGPANLTTANLDNFNGENPNGVWRLFVRDDAQFDTGSITNWFVRVETTTSEIVIPGTGNAGNANPFPSVKTFNTPPGEVIADVDLKVDEFSHMHPSDVDMVLQGPEGQTTMVMSDSCGGDDINGFGWDFDDEAPATMTNGSITGCDPVNVRPSNFGPGGESLLAPGPQGPYGSTLSVFDGLEGGEWRLFITDDGGNDTGYMKGWEVQLTTRPPAETGFANPSLQATEGETASFQVSRSGAASLGPADLAVEFVPGSAGTDDASAPPAVLHFARDEVTKTIEVPVADDAAEESAETFKLVLSGASDDARLTGTSEATATIAESDRVTISQPPPPKPSNEFGLGKVVKRANGSVELPVTVPGAGALSAVGSKIKPAEAAASGADTVELLLKPSKAAKKQLKKGKKVKAAVEVAFTPTGGDPAAKTATVPLKRKTRGR